MRKTLIFALTIWSLTVIGQEPESMESEKIVTIDYEAEPWEAKIPDATKKLENELEKSKQANCGASRSIASIDDEQIQNPYSFSSKDMMRIDAYAESLGMTRAQAVRILTVQGLNKQ